MLVTSIIRRSRPSNSRGGKVFGATKYDQFWKECEEVLLSSAAAEERRHTYVIYASGGHSFPNLVTSATEVLQRKVDGKELAHLPAIPSNEWVRLQFVPNCADQEIAANFTGRLKANRAVQTRTLR